MDEKKLEQKTLEEREATTLQDLRGIYENESGELPDLSTLEAPERSWRKSALFSSGVLLLLSSAILGGFFLLGGFTFGGGSDQLLIDVIARPIEVEEERSEPLVSGAPSRIAIRYQNESKTPIASLSIRVNLPEAFIVDRFVPEATSEGNTWDLGSLNASSDGVIELYGTPIGTVPSTQKIQIIATYRPANFSSEFDSITVEELVLEKGVLELSVSSPDKASPGEPISLAFELLNPTQNAVTSIQLIAVVPEGFQVTKSEPPIEEGLFWNIPRMEAHSKTSFMLTGTMSANTRGLHDMGGAISLTHNSRRFLQSERLRPVEVFGGALATNVIVNGSAKDQNVDPGTLLRISIPIENASEIDLENVELELAFAGSGTIPIDWEGAGAHFGAGSKTGNSLLWDRGDLDAFEAFAGGDELTIDLALPLFETLPEGSADVFSITATVAATPATGNDSRLSLSTTPITIRVNSGVNFFSSALSHDQTGSAIGQSPLPPKVGETTTYTIVWSVQNDLHALETLVLETELPSYVSFEEGVTTSLGTISYRVDRRVVRWEIPLVEGNASAKFNVSVTPKEGDVGTFLKLTNLSTLSAKDAETGSQIRKESPALTTVLRDDTFAEDDGIVVE